MELSRLIATFKVSRFIYLFGPFRRLRSLSGASGSMTGVTERRRFRKVRGGNCTLCGRSVAEGESGGVGAPGLGGMTGAFMELEERDIRDQRRSKKGMLVVWVGR
jgi:hypothetical protein